MKQKVIKTESGYMSVWEKLARSVVKLEELANTPARDWDKYMTRYSLHIEDTENLHDYEDEVWGINKEDAARLFHRRLPYESRADWNASDLIPFINEK